MHTWVCMRSLLPGLPASSFWSLAACKKKKKKKKKKREREGLGLFTMWSSARDVTGSRHKDILKFIYPATEKLRNKTCSCRYRETSPTSRTQLSLKQNNRWRMVLLQAFQGSPTLNCYISRLWWAMLNLISGLFYIDFALAACMATWKLLHA